MSARVAGVVQRLGIPGVVLLAAVLCDLLIVLAIPDGIIGRTLLLLAASFAMAACAMWWRAVPVPASIAAALVLGASTVLLKDASVTMFPSLLRNITFGETVAGFVLVMQCARLARPLRAAGAITVLILAALVAVTYRSSNWYWSGTSVFGTAAAGLLLLVAGIAAGLRLRKPEVPAPAQGFASPLLRDQWPLIGAFSLLLFIEMTTVFGQEPAGWGVLFFSIVAALAAVLASSNAERWATAVGMALLGTVTITVLTGTDQYGGAGAIPPAQVLAGMTSVVALVRALPAARAVPYILAMSTIVAFSAVGASRGTVKSLAVSAVLLLGISVAFGLFLRTRDSERHKTMKSAVTDAQTAERMALARELHDVVAHHVTGIVVQAQAAKLVSDKDPAVALRALDRIEDAGLEALGSMRRLVRSMRGEPPAGTTAISEQATTDLAADLRRLVESASLRVPTEVTVELPDALPQDVARSTLRIVQESLTNVGKHATEATLARVVVGPIGDELHVRIRDDGAKPVTGDGALGAGVGGSGGYGLVGMRERVELLEGRLSAGPHADGGWLVEAWLPCGAAKPEGEQ